MSATYWTLGRTRAGQEVGAVDTATDVRSWDADEAVTQLYLVHYARLVRLATLLLGDQAVAEEVVQDSFVAMHGRWGRLRDPDRAVGYLRQTVVNRSRSALRRRAVAARHLPSRLADVESAEVTALGAERRAEILALVRTLPTRQREVVVLRYYLDLSEADIASTLGISRGAVKSHAHRALSALRAAWEAAS